MFLFLAVKKFKKAKKEPKKAAGKKKKQKEAECAGSLMAELPFANTEVWRELGCESTLSLLEQQLRLDLPLKAAVRRGSCRLVSSSGCGNHCTKRRSMADTERAAPD